MIARPVLYVEDHADSVALVETLLAGRKDLQRAEPFMEALDFALEFAAVEHSEHNPLLSPRQAERNSR